MTDLNEEALQATVSSLPPTPQLKIESQRIDVTDGPALRHVLDTADIVLNVTGPYYRFGLPVLKAVIDARTHYLHHCDDWEPTIAMMNLNDQAKDAGITAVIGMGASPGVSNLLAALVHWMQQISGQIQVVHNGQLVSQSPLQPVQLDYPGHGSGTAYTVGQPEPITLYDHVPICGQSACLMVITPPILAYLDRLRNKLGAKTLTNEEAARQVAHPSTWGEIGAFVRSFALDGPGKLPPFFVLATGELDRRPRSIGILTHSFPQDMGLVTGLPLAVGPKEILDGRVTAPGVFAPEGAFQPESFFENLALLWELDESALFMIRRS